MTAVCLLPLAAGLVIFATVRVPSVSAWFESRALSRRKQSVSTGSASSRLAKTRAAFDSSPTPSESVEEAVAEWLHTATSIPRRLSTFLLPFGAVSSALFYLVFVVCPPLAQSRGWTYDQFLGFATAATALVAAVLLIASTAIIVASGAQDRRARMLPGNLQADALLRTRLTDGEAVTVDVSRYPLLARLVDVRHV